MVEADSAPLSLEKLFQQALPYYLMLGMTADEYWHGDVELAVAYRKADAMRQARINETAWLNGMYIYEAMINVAPIYQTFNKHPRVQPYPDKPYDISAHKQTENVDSDMRMKAALESMKAWADKVNKSKGVTDNAGKH